MRVAGPAAGGGRIGGKGILFLAFDMVSLHWPATDILLVAPAKEPPADKKDDGGKPADDAKKQEAPKKEGGAVEPKKDEKKEKKEADGGGGKEAAAAPPEYDPAVMEMVKAYKAYNPVYMETYHVKSEEENACAIC